MREVWCRTRPHRVGEKVRFQDARHRISGRVESRDATKDHVFRVHIEEDQRTPSDVGAVLAWTWIPGCERRRLFNDAGEELLEGEELPPAAALALPQFGGPGTVYNYGGAARLINYATNGTRWFIDDPAR